METIRTRAAEFRAFGVTEIDAEKRTATFSASSEFPVERYDWRREEFFQEVLSHDPKDVDLSRMRDGAPALDTHWGDVVGVVESAEIVDKRMVIKARYSDATERAKAVFADIVSGIRRNVSVGYTKTRVISSAVDENGKRTVRFAWQPYEVSHVSVPADPTVGIGRDQKCECRELPLPEEPAKSSKIPKTIILI